MTLRSLADQTNFHVGAAVSAFHLDDPALVEILRREFNMLTPENEAKACNIQPELGQFDFRAFDRLVAFAEANDMMVHGHTLVWHQCVPGWLANGQYSRDDAIALLRDHIMTEVGRYKGRVAIWDVVNEAIDDNGEMRNTPWHRLIGNDYVELAFRFAHEADPDALLFYNDYGTEGMNGKSDAVYDMVSDFLARGVPINGVGLQAHFTVGTINPTAISDNIKRLGDLGLQVQITEMDVRYVGDTTDDILRRQAGDYRMVIDSCLAHDNCTAFITWGVSDRYSWLRSPNLSFFNNTFVDPLMFDEDYQPKPAYRAVEDALARHAGLPPILNDDEVAALLGRPTRAASTPAAPVETVKSDPAQLAPDSVPGQIYYAAFPVAIRMNGSAEDWANIPRVTVDQGPMLPPNNTNKLTFAAASDGLYLYFLADVQDSNVVYGTHDPAAEWYKEDSVEFYLNATGDLSLTSYQPGVAQIAILAANIDNRNPLAPIIGGANSTDSRVQAVVKRTDAGYLVEARVPLSTSVWSIHPQHLSVLGFQVALNGASDPSDRDTKLIWSAADTTDQSWTNPSLFGQLVFWDKNR